MCKCIKQTIILQIYLNKWFDMHLKLKMADNFSRQIPKICELFIFLSKITLIFSEQLYYFSPHYVVNATNTTKQLYNYLLYLPVHRKLTFIAYYTWHFVRADSHTLPVGPMSLFFVTAFCFKSIYVPLYHLEQSQYSNYNNTEILEFNLFAYGYKLFHKDFSSLNVARDLCPVEWREIFMKQSVGKFK